MTEAIIAQTSRPSPCFPQEDMSMHNVHKVVMKCFLVPTERRLIAKLSALITTILYIKKNFLATFMGIYENHEPGGLSQLQAVFDHSNRSSNIDKLKEVKMTCLTMF